VTRKTIVHLTTRDAWLAARQTGIYTTPSLDSEGFIHCSRPDQIVKVANVFYTGQSGLVLLVIEPSRMTSPLKWEPPAHPAPGPAPVTGDLFPHLYGPLNLDAVTSVLDFPLDETGLFHLPPSLVTEH
jgi:uncharacterized protein (DUF952 family)